MTQGDIYDLVVKNQYVDGIFIREGWTLFGKRYEFECKVTTRYEDGSIYKHKKIYKIKRKDILKKPKS